MTIKKRFDYFFNNITNCKRKCLEYVVVFGKLIFVVRGSWDGSIPYKTTDENNKTRKGITGRVVKTVSLDISGVTYTKVLYKTKTRLSHSPRKGYFNSFKNNGVYGLNLNLLTDPADLAFLFYDRIMIPTTFTIPSSITGDGILPILLDGVNFNGAYVTNAELFETHIFQKDKKFKKLIGKTVISKTTTTVRDGGKVISYTQPGSVISSTDDTVTEKDPNLIQTFYMGTELIQDVNDPNLNKQEIYYDVSNDTDELEEFIDGRFIQFLWRAYKTFYTPDYTSMLSHIKLQIKYDSTFTSGQKAISSSEKVYEIDFSLDNLKFDTNYKKNFSGAGGFLDGLTYIKISIIDNSRLVPSYCILRGDDAPSVEIYPCISNCSCQFNSS